MAKLTDDFQTRVQPWLLECFSVEVCRDKLGRNHRFLEESLELVQSMSCTRDDAHALVDYVYNRQTGQPVQEVGGVMVTPCVGHEHACCRGNRVESYLG